MVTGRSMREDYDWRIVDMSLCGAVEMSAMMSFTSTDQRYRFMCSAEVEGLVEA